MAGPAGTNAMGDAPGATGHALVTGASSGIGRAFALRLAREGYAVLAVARRAERLAALAHEAERLGGGRVEPAATDLSRPDDLRRLEARLARDAELAVLVNNAGLASGVPFPGDDPGALEAMLQVQLTAAVRLARAALPGMLARGRGVIINVSSVGAFDTAPSAAFAVYVPAKRFLTSFSRALHELARGTGVRVQALCPGPVGPVRTEIYARAGLPFPFPAAATMTPEALVEASLAGLRRGEALCVPTLDDPSLLTRLESLEDALFDRAIAAGAAAPRYAQPRE
jgi:short-subunit dehydrogenase